jgi:hypothetical protein
VEERGALVGEGMKGRVWEKGKRKGGKEVGERERRGSVRFADGAPEIVYGHAIGVVGVGELLVKVLVGEGLDAHDLEGRVACELRTSKSNQDQQAPTTRFDTQTMKGGIPQRRRRKDSSQARGSSGWSGPRGT